MKNNVINLKPTGEYFTLTFIFHDVDLDALHLISGNEKKMQQCFTYLFIVFN